MAEIINMKLMRYINLFSKISHISTTKCFVYNGQIIFAVPKSNVSLAIGKNAVNVKKLRSILRKPIKVIAMPLVDSNEGIKIFVKDVVNPIEFNKIEINENSAIITAGRQSKAALIGRNRIREKELSDVLKNFFKIEKLKIS